MSDKKERFYNKKWFMFLMLFFIAPIGIILLFKNKHFTKKTNIILSVVFGIWFIIAMVQSQPTEEEKREEEAKAEQREQEKKEEEQAEKEAEEEKEKKEEEEKEAEKERKANRDIDEAISEDVDDVSDAVFENGSLEIERHVEDFLTVNYLFHDVYDLFEAMNLAFEDDEVERVKVIISSTVVDSKGNEKKEDAITYDYERETFNELNYDEFTNMAYAEQWRILAEADMYFVNPGLYANLKEKYTENLSPGFN